MLKGFRDFILRGNVVDLAIAVVIGAAFTAIVNALVTAHGGTVGVNTSPGQGATFWITLPLAPEAAAD